jgi:hypothetical protein
MPKDKNFILSGISKNVTHFWIWADVTGDGNRWNLAVFRRMDDGERSIYFIDEDFEDYAGNYHDRYISEIHKPSPMEE